MTLLCPVNLCRGCGLVGVGLVLEVAEDLAGDDPFEASPGFAGGFAVGGAAGGAGSMRARVRAMVCRARLSWRSPERLRRWRVVSPEDAGMGAAPEKAA